MRGNQPPTAWLLLLLLFSISRSCLSERECNFIQSRITVVYGALVWPDHDWAALIAGQLGDLNASGLVGDPRLSSLNVVLSIPESHGDMTEADLEELLASAISLVERELPSASIFAFGHNAFEFPALHLLWSIAHSLTEEEAQQNSMLYFHSKGMVHHRHDQAARLDIEKQLSSLTINAWQQVVNLMEERPALTRVGLYPTQHGSMWFNFFWARASYIQHLQEPLKTTYRYYFEHWLGLTVELDPPLTQTDIYGGSCDTCLGLICSKNHSVLGQLSWRPMDIPEPALWGSMMAADCSPIDEFPKLYQMETTVEALLDFGLDDDNVWRINVKRQERDGGIAIYRETANSIYYLFPELVERMLGNAENALAAEALMSFLTSTPPRDNSSS